MQIAKHKVVTINYTLKDEEGEIIDSSQDSDPLSYIQGVGALIPGLEQALEGRQQGDAFGVDIAPENGYGEYDEELVRVVSRRQFREVEVEVGMQVEAKGEGADEDMVLTVVDIEGDEVTLDGNHPLAGMVLHFDIEVMEVRNATAEELSHGHVHGSGGHHH